MGFSTRRAKGITGTIWLVSWFFLYREIYVWHHVTRSFRLNPPPPIPGRPPPRPGLFLIAVLVAFPAAPVLFFVLVALGHMRQTPRRQVDATAPFG